MDGTKNNDKIKFQLKNDIYIYIILYISWPALIDFSELCMIFIHFSDLPPSWKGRRRPWYIYNIVFLHVVAEIQENFGTLCFRGGQLKMIFWRSSIVVFYRSWKPFGRPLISHHNTVSNLIRNKVMGAQVLGPKTPKVLVWPPWFQNISDFKMGCKLRGLEHPKGPYFN